MIIVGLTGGIGHGKTTLAEYLAKHAKKHRHWETWQVVGEVAATLRHEKPEHPDPENLEAINAWLADLPDIITTVAHTPADFTQLALTPERLSEHPEHYEKLLEYLRLMQANPELQTIEITAENKAIFRTILQWLGGFLVEKVDPGIWYDEIVRRVHQSEAEGLDLATVGGVRYPTDAERLRNANGFIIEIKRPDVTEQDLQDLTERERRLITPDSTVVNDGSLKQLGECAKGLYKDLAERSLRSNYTTSEF